MDCLVTWSVVLVSCMTIARFRSTYFYLYRAAATAINGKCVNIHMGFLDRGRKFVPRLPPHRYKIPVARVESGASGNRRTVLKPSDND